MYAEAKTQITENPRNSDNFSKLRSKVGKTQILRHIQVARKDSHSPDICDSPDTLCFVYKKLLYKKVEAQIVQKLRNLLYDDVIVTIKGFEAHFRKQLSYKKN